MKGDALPTNSLADLICNTVGILVLLSLISVAQTGGKTYTVRVPVEEPSSLRPVFFVCMADRIVHLDLGVVLQRLARVAARRDLPPRRKVDLQYHGLSGRYVPTTVTDEGGSLELVVGDTISWTARPDLIKQGGAARVLSNLDPRSEFAYFFVYISPVTAPRSGGLSVFRTARALLPGGVRSGWRPLDAGMAVEICGWQRNEACHYRPSHHWSTGGQNASDS